MQQSHALVDGRVFVKGKTQRAKFVVYLFVSMKTI